MPPKRAALAQALRDAYPEDTSCGVIEAFAGDSLQRVEAYIEKVNGARDHIRNAEYVAAKHAAAPNAAVLALLQEYQQIAEATFLASDKVRTVISIRIPELKEEDNLGVAVQRAVLREIDALQAALLGGGGGGSSGDREGGSSGGSAPVGMFAARDYLASRGAIEDKLLGKPGGENEEKTSGASRAPSTLLELKQLDNDVLLKIQLAAVQLATRIRAFINTYALNWKKLIQPRTQNDKMVA